MPSNVIEERTATQKPLLVSKHLNLNTYDNDGELFIEASGINYKIEFKDEDGTDLRILFKDLLEACYDLGVYAALQRPMHRRGSRLTYYREVMGNTICFVPQN